VIVMQDIFRYVQTGVKNGNVEGYFTATGVRPKFMEQIEAAGLTIPPSSFAPSQQKKRG
jgi:pilus assembly protein CpaF